MIETILWGIGMLVLVSCASDDSVPDGKRDPSDPPAVPPKEKDTYQPPALERREYEQPKQPSFPQATNYGIFYHSLVQETKMVQETANDGGTDGGIDGGMDGSELSSPVGFQCDNDSVTCYFASGADLFSFAEENLSNSDPLALTKRATFAQPLVDFLIKNGFAYGLYNGRPSGVEVQTLEGDLIDRQTFGGDGFFEQRPLLTALTSVNNELWISSPREEGTLFVLRENGDGSLDTSPKGPFSTTQLNPQAFANWEGGNQTYLLAVNRGGNDRLTMESGVDVFDPSADENQHLGNIPLGAASANTIALSEDQKAAFIGSARKPNLYLLDLERLQKNLEAMESREKPESWEDVALASADNPVLLSPFETGSVSGLAYDASTKTALASLYNEGFLLQVRSNYELLAGDGIVIAPDFGVIVGNYLCNNLETQACSELALTESGVLEMTENPTGATFLPNERFGR